MEQNELNNQNQQPEQKQPKKKGLNWLAIVLCCLAVICAGMWISSSSEAKKLATQKADTETMLKSSEKENEAAQAKIDSLDKVKSEIEAEAATNAELAKVKADSLALVQAKADSIVSQNEELAAQLATAKTGTGKSQGYTRAQLKGHPVVDKDKNEFHYVKSDSLLAKAAPAGFKLIEHPR